MVKAMFENMKWDPITVLKGVYELVCVVLFSLVIGCAMGSLGMTTMGDLKHVPMSLAMGEGSFVGGGVAILLGPILYYGMVREYLNMKNLGLLVAVCIIPSMFFALIINPMISIVMPPSILGLGSLLIRIKEFEKTLPIQHQRTLFQYVERYNNNRIKFFIEFICVVTFSLLLGLGMNVLYFAGNGFYMGDLAIMLVSAGLIVYPVLGLILYYGLVRKYLNLYYLGFLLVAVFFTNTTVEYFFHGIIPMILNPLFFLIGCYWIWSRESLKRKAMSGSSGEVAV